MGFPQLAAVALAILKLRLGHALVKLEDAIRKAFQLRLPDPQDGIFQSKSSLHGSTQIGTDKEWESCLQRALRTGEPSGCRADLIANDPDRPRCATSIRTIWPARLGGDS